ncbi:MAG: energy transducer TonB [Gemmatimonadetes bacterium]|nr:energy transducer TonB [Gemmatimonadota bacterium]
MSFRSPRRERGFPPASSRVPSASQERSRASAGWSAGDAPIRLIWLASFAVVGCFGPNEIEQPVPLYGEEPIEYPLGLWDEGLEGQTVLRVRVTDVGTVDSVEVTESSGHLALDSAAVAGVRDLRFQPGQRNGNRVRMWATLPVLFSRRPQAPGG